MNYRIAPRGKKQSACKFSKVLFAEGEERGGDLAKACVIVCDARAERDRGKSEER